MPSVLNACAYRFVPLADANGLRERLLEEGRALGLCGTVLLAPEGINLFVAGQAEAVEQFLARLQRDERFAGLPVRRSWSQEVPFRRWRVKLKREIIRMNEPGIRPTAGRAPALAAPTLRRWLDQGHDGQGRPVVLLDTRNGFEVDRGRFRGALDWRLERFSDFPAALRAHRAQLEGKTVVSYCTGGIRCEKAALHMLQAGVGEVWQLEGGILQYFEDAAGAHFEGECFVFDEREALDASLSPRTAAPAG